MTYGEAIEELRMGEAVARQGWVARGFSVLLVEPPGETLQFFIVDDPTLTSRKWWPSHQDMLATDWVVV
jgi:hypothetical protein